MEVKIDNSKLKEETQASKFQTDYSPNEAEKPGWVETRILELIRETLETSSYVSTTDEMLIMLQDDSLAEETTLTFQRVFLKVLKGTTKTNQIGEAMSNVSLQSF